MQKAFHTFYIERTEFDTITLTARFFYSFDHEREFVEEVCFANREFTPRSDIDGTVFTGLLSHISVALGISYYKLFPTRKIVVEHMSLDADMRIFWNKFYVLGLGEFFYRNNINPSGLAQFESHSEKGYTKKVFSLRDRAIVPVGGGKDSIVTIEKVIRSGVDMDLFTFGKDNPIYEDMAHISEKQRLYVQRRLAPTLFEMNNEGYYNGHVPITGVISFVLLFVAYLYEYKYIIFSNEQSSNYGNLDFHGINVNHQYSKSKEFEDDFRKYLRDYISDDIEYFSMMRPYYEVAIIEQFSHEKKYFPYFTSCNTNFKLLESEPRKNRWCLKCPKCAFVYGCLHPFLTAAERKEIFHEDMYEDAELIPLFEELTGVDGHKPFECVGTNEEILWSMRSSISKYGDTPLPIVLDTIQRKALSHMSTTEFDALEQKLFREYPHNIPAKFSNI